MEAQNNRACLFCWEHAASHFCPCSDPPSFFCVDCFSTHYAKSPHTVHQTIPIAALGQNPEEYMRRSRAVAKGAAELHRNVELVEQCCRDFEAMLQACSSYLSEYRTWWLQRMQVEKEALAVAIDTAVRETTECLDQGTEPVSPLAQALWTLPSEDLHIVRYSVTLPDLQALLVSCTSYHNHMPQLCERFLSPPPSLEAVERLKEACRKHALPQSVLTEWLRQLKDLRQTHLLVPLFQQISNIKQASAQMVFTLVNSTLVLCAHNSRETSEVAKGVSDLLDTQVVAVLTSVSDSAQAVALLDRLLQQPKGPEFTACLELSTLLSRCCREGVPGPDLLVSLLQRPAQLAKLAQLCSSLLRSSAYSLTGLCTRLVKALESTAEVDLLFFVPTLATELTQVVPPEVVEELGLLLLTALETPVHLETLKKLQASKAQVQDALVKLLNRRERLTIQALEQLFLPSEFKTLVQVTAVSLRFFNCQTAAWSAQVQLRRKIQANDQSSWVLLKDARVFCSGGFSAGSKAT